ncbi:hypothetical protein FEM48_Zijuj09G0056000 [Ziziphus jujuba var. spinosa]|uniref:Uncharacterized protein n=1 Tax=Ziziphus jujuba var. spinosa TaxID=714518 RepID=A0A978UR66_ZIZJJ|nr:hypothetical protein FEM48_Zijuj09G0056000 [Ziziphus jujuba var. spinosa]
MNTNTGIRALRRRNLLRFPVVLVKVIIYGVEVDIQVSIFNGNSNSLPASSSSLPGAVIEIENGLGTRQEREVIEFEYLDDKLLEELLGIEENGQGNNTQ